MERGDLSRFASFSVWGPLLLLALLTAVVRLPFVAEPPGRDQALFMTQAQRLAAGGRLYADVWEHKQPGIVALYGGAMAIAGDSYTAIQLLNAIAGFTTAALLLLLFRRAGCGLPAALAAGGLYLLFYGGPLFGGFWATAQVEILLDPLVAAALYCLLPAGADTAQAESARSSGRLFAGGVALGTAVFWLKYSCAPLACLALLPLWLPTSGLAGSAANTTHAAQRHRPAWRGRVRGVAAVLAGMSLAPLLMLLYFAWSGRVGEFWHATIVFNIAHRAVAAFQPDGAARWILLVLFEPGPLAALYVFSALALYGHLGRTKNARAGDAVGEPASPGGRLLVAGVLLWVLALAEVLLQGKFWVYHYHVVLLPLSITAALGLDWFARQLTGRIGGRPAWGVAAVAAIALLWPQGSLMSEYLKTHRIPDHWSGGLSRERYLESYRWGRGGDFDAAENQVVAARVEADTRAGDTIFVWGFEPSIYLLSQRAPASRFLYDYPLMPELGEVHARHLDWLMDDLETAAPAMFLVLHRDANDLESLDSATQLSSLARLRQFLARDYRPVWRQGDFSAFRRRDQPEAALRE
jgi:hypothetical protein